VFPAFLIKEVNMFTNSQKRRSNQSTLVSTADRLSVTWSLVGLVGVIITAATFWITRRNNRSIGTAIQLLLTYQGQEEFSLSSRA
jgi:FtsH-binding integral membrane protein